MIYTCQRDSYKQALTTKVISCNKLRNDNGREVYHAILEDTVLFPEGGGQPSDTGIIAGVVPVISVKREKGLAVHILTSPIEPKEEVKVILHWARRYDHMQQHSGQHLISAIAENALKLRTTSWNLRMHDSYIELDTPEISAFQIDHIENLVNDVIRKCVPITIEYYNKGDEALSSVRTRLELPDYDHDGQIRVVTIQGIDKNTCCGTHVRNSSELQIIKLLYTEKGKKGRTNLYFMAGNRVLKYLQKTIYREKKLSSMLGCKPELQHKFVEQLQTSSKNNSKVALKALRNIAALEAKVFNLQNPKPKFFSLHREDADQDFISVFLAEAKSEDTLFFLTVGDPKHGHMTLSGPLAIVQAYGPQVCEILEGRGAMKNRSFHAKVKLDNIPQAEKLLKGVCDDAASK